MPDREESDDPELRPDPSRNARVDRVAPASRPARRRRPARDELEVGREGRLDPIGHRHRDVDAAPLGRIARNHAVMCALYHEGNRELQDRSTRGASPTGWRSVTVGETIDDRDRAFIERQDMFFLATADEDGPRPARTRAASRASSASLDERTIAFPNYDGNGMYLTTGNLLRNPQRRPPLHLVQEQSAFA